MGATSLLPLHRDEYATHQTSIKEVVAMLKAEDRLTESPFFPENVSSNDRTITRDEALESLKRVQAHGVGSGCLPFVSRAARRNWS